MIKYRETTFSLKATKGFRIICIQKNNWNEEGIKLVGPSRRWLSPNCPLANLTWSISWGDCSCSIFEKVRLQVTYGFYVGPMARKLICFHFGKTWTRKINSPNYYRDGSWRASNGGVLRHDAWRFILGRKAYQKSFYSKRKVHTNKKAYVRPFYKHCPHETFWVFSICTALSEEGSSLCEKLRCGRRTCLVTTAWTRERQSHEAWT